MSLTRQIERSAKERISDWEETRHAISHDIAKKESERCNYCFEAPCVDGCPAGVDVAAFVRRIRVGDSKSAIRIIREANPLAGICARICPAEELCVKECRNQYATSPLDIPALQRYVADEELITGIRIPEITKSKKARKVACIGAGPAGLACATELAKRGYDVTVFEQQKKAGGMLTYGIPSYRLSQRIVDAEVGYVRKLGVTITIGQKISSLKELKGYKAVFIGTGAWKTKRLDIPGANLKGVWDALDFIAAAKGKKKPEAGHTIAIFGGGNTAMDCAGTALRLGAKRVIIIYRRSKAEMPAWESEVDSTFKEGTEVLFLAAPVRIMGEKQVEGVECIRMKLGKTDKSGRPRPIPVEGTEFTIAAETVVQAVGQGPDDELLAQLGVPTDIRGRAKIRKNGATALPGVFAGGDVVNGGATAVQAVAEGKKAAEAIDAYLNKK